MSMENLKTLCCEDHRATVCSDLTYDGLNHVGKVGQSLITLCEIDEVIIIHVISHFSK